MKRVDIAIITVLPEEFAAVRALLQRPIPFPGVQEDPNLYGWELGRVRLRNKNLTYKVVLAQTGHAGTVPASLVTSHTIVRWAPRYVFFVGIAGGFKERGVKLGDVVLSDVIWAYEYGKITKGRFVPRHDLTYRCDTSLLAGAQSFNQRSNWNTKQKRNARPTSRQPRSKMQIGPVASGDKVVDDPNAKFFRSVLQAWPQLVAVEMEGAGCAAAIAAAQSAGRALSYLMVRGISDLPKMGQATELGNAERDQWKKFAAEAAALFTVEYIRSGLPSRPSRTPRSTSTRKTLRKMATTTSYLGASSFASAPSRLPTELEIRDRIRLAIDGLLSYRNRDGGIPATRPGQSSGAWTTASCLEAATSYRFASIESLYGLVPLVEFLLNTQLPDGGWPLIDADVSSTMSTGHTVSALMACDEFTIFDAHSKQIRKAIKDGFGWLKTNSLHGGGWGVESPRHAEGPQARIVSTFYALRPYLRAGVVPRRPVIVRDAVLRFLDSKNDDGGWPYCEGDRCSSGSDASNTARVMLVLLRSGHSRRHSSRIASAADCIVAKRFGPSWRLSIEGFFSSASHGQNIYHNNSPCDAVEALLESGCHLRVAMSAILWLLQGQHENGIWELRSPDPEQRDFYRAWTWPTSEFVHTLNLALKMGMFTKKTTRSRA